jgi:hypothetical protein
MNIKDFAPAIKEKAEEAFEERKTISEKAAATAKGVCDRSFGLGTYDELLKAAASVLEEPQSDSSRIYDNGSVRAEAIGSKDPERTPGTLILSVGSKKCKAVVGELEGDFPRIDSNDAVALALDRKITGGKLLEKCQELAGAVEGDSIFEKIIELANLKVSDLPYAPFDPKVIGKRLKGAICDVNLSSAIETPTLQVTFFGQSDENDVFERVDGGILPILAGRKEIANLKVDTWEEAIAASRQTAGINAEKSEETARNLTFKQKAAKKAADGYNAIAKTAESILKSNDELSIVVSVAEFANNAKDSLNVEIDGATVWARKNERGVDIGIQIKTNGGGRFDVMVENISVDSNVEKNVFGAFAKMKADAYEKKISYEKIVETLSDEAESKRKEEDFERSLGLDDEK